MKARGMEAMSEDDTEKAIQYSRISTVLSTSAYAIVCVLFVATMRLRHLHAIRLKRNRILGQTPEPRRLLLWMYRFFMFGISTLAIITTLLINFRYRTASFLSFSPESLNANLCKTCSFFPMRMMENGWITIVIWGADSFMIWRCTLLYNGISQNRRALLLTLCAAMVLISFGVGLLYTFPFTETGLSLTFFASVTLAINIIITALVVGRLLYHRQVMRDALGPGNGSRYTKIIAMFVESSGLVVGFNPALVAMIYLKAKSHAAVILLQMMVQVYIISRSLIMFKVHYNGLYSDHTTEYINCVASRVVNRDLPLEFSRPTSIKSGPTESYRGDFTSTM